MTNHRPPPSSSLFASLGANACCPLVGLAQAFKPPARAPLMLHVALLLVRGLSSRHSLLRLISTIILMSLSVVVLQRGFLKKCACTGCVGGEGTPRGGGPTTPAHDCRCDRKPRSEVRYGRFASAATGIIYVPAAAPMRLTQQRRPRTLPYNPSADGVRLIYYQLWCVRVIIIVCLGSFYCCPFVCVCAVCVV